MTNFHLDRARLKNQRTRPFIRQDWVIELTMAWEKSLNASISHVVTLIITWNKNRRLLSTTMNFKKKSKRQLSKWEDFLDWREKFKKNYKNLRLTLYRMMAKLVYKAQTVPDSTSKCIEARNDNKRKNFYSLYWKTNQVPVRLLKWTSYSRCSGMRRLMLIRCIQELTKRGRQESKTS